MRELTKAEALQLAKSGTKFLVGGRELGPKDIIALPSPAIKKQGILARFADQLINTLREGLHRLSQSHDHAIRTQSALLELLAKDEGQSFTLRVIERDPKGGIKVLTITPDQ